MVAIVAVPCTILMLFGFFVRGPLAFTYLYFGLSVLCFVAIMAMLSELADIWMSRPQILCSASTITLPRWGWSRKNAVLSYSMIESCEIVDDRYGRRMVMAYKDRSPYVIMENSFAGRDAFEELWSAIDFLSTAAATGFVSEHRRVLCSLCSCPIPLSLAERNGGRCPICASKTVTDFRMQGLKLVGIGIVFELFCSLLVLGFWAAGGRMQVGQAATGVVIGLVVILVGLYAAVSGKPIRLRL